MNGYLSSQLMVGFIGGGINSAVGQAHYSAICLGNNFQLVSGCFSRNAEINSKTAESYRISNKRVYRTIDELIDNEKRKIDAIII